MRKTQEIIDAIKSDLDEGDLSQRKIAERYGVHHSFVGKVKRGLAKPLVTSARTEVPQADPTDSRVLQLESKLIAITDERNSLKRANKVLQREQSIFESLVDEMNSVVKPIKPLPRAIKVKNGGKKIKESLVLHLSDEHADEIVLPESVGNLETYNFLIALRRAETLVDTIIKFSQETLFNYQFDTLYILANGDHVNGCIHNATEHSQYRNSFRNALAVGQLHALMFRDLSPWFKDIKVVYTPGNHARLGPKKDYHGARQSWDYLVAEIAKIHCKDLNNIDFLIPDAYSINIKIEESTFCVSHGDDVRSFGQLPLYGIQRKVNRWTALGASVGEQIRYFCFGHFHQLANLTNLNGEILLNGSWIACSSYVYNALSTWGEPMQLLHGVHPQRGVSWRLPITLRTPNESEGPRRYQISLAE